MSAAVIAQLIIALGPPAFEVIQQLIAVWKKGDLSPEEVQAFCDRSKKSYDEYIAEAKKSNV